MAVIECRRKSVETSFNSNGQNTGTWVYWLTSDIKMPEPYLIYLGGLTATPEPLPPPYAEYLGGLYVLSVRIRQRKEDNGKIWEAVVELGPLPDGADPGQGDPNPFLRPPVVWMEDLSETELLTKDRDGNPTVNAAGDPFDEPPTRERRLPVFVMRRNYTDLNVIAKLNKRYDNSVNSADMFNNEWPAGTVQFSPIVAGEPQTANGVSYYAGECRFVCRSEGWKMPILNRGWRYWTLPKTDPNAIILNATDDEIMAAKGPILLQLDGTKLPKGSTGTFIEYNFSPEEDLNDLFLPYPQNEA